MTTRVSYIITDNNITVNYGGQTHIISRKERLSNRLIDALKNNKLDEIPKLIETAKRVVEFGQGNFTVEGGRIMINGVAAPALLSRKILQFMNESLPVEPLIKFAENLLKNPSYRAVNELFQFLEKNDHPITENGNFLAFKKVRDDFTDVYTGTFDNHPDQVLEMPRNQVDENCNSHCSNGFHVGNWRYCHEFNGDNGIMLEVEVNPSDVVSVPNDLDEKIRVCKYKVLGTIENPFDNDTLLVVKSKEDEEKNEGEDRCLSCEELCEPYEDVCENCNTHCEYCGEHCQHEQRICYECSKEECPSCGGDRQDCDGKGEDKYPWEDELTDF